MSKTISEIYTEYKIMPSLQMHMFRVAAVASLICDNFTKSLPKEEILLACLLHDMGNIIKSDLKYFPEFVKPEGLDYWAKVQGEFKEKYGTNEHNATIQIIKELGLPERISALVDQIRFSLICEHSISSDLGLKIVHYADARVGPHGTMSYLERMEEGRKRYATRGISIGGVDDKDRERLIGCGQEIEKQIFAKCKIKPEDITDQAIAPIISELKNFVLK